MGAGELGYLWLEVEVPGNVPPNSHSLVAWKIFLQIYDELLLSSVYFRHPESMHCRIIKCDEFSLKIAVHSFFVLKYCWSVWHSSTHIAGRFHTMVYSTTFAEALDLSGLIFFIFIFRPFTFGGGNTAYPSSFLPKDIISLCSSFHKCPYWQVSLLNFTPEKSIFKRFFVWNTEMHGCYYWVWQISDSSRQVCLSKEKTSTLFFLTSWITDMLSSKCNNFLQDSPNI